ncbi:MAG: TlpA disulfide reductase family protein [Anaerolineaceae bacterium]|nr:TlpA disulfide reductase family protein [Anaerolineaceae bacterium]
MNEKAATKIDTLSILVLGILVIQSLLIIILLDSVKKLNSQVSIVLQSSAGSTVSLPNPLIGKPYVDFELADSEGDRFLLSNHLNKPTLLVFSNHQCSACQKMYPELQKFIADNPQIDVIIIASNSQEQNAEFVQAFTQNVTNVSVLEGTQEVFEHYGVSATPTFFSLNSDGTIIHSASVMTEKQIVELMQGTN